MNTSLLVRSLSMAALEFRFLYGRWIRAWYSSGIAAFTGSDSSMVDEYTKSFTKFEEDWESSDSSMVDEYTGTGSQE